MPQNFDQLSVTGTNLDGTTVDLTHLVNWSVSDPTIMTIGVGSSDGVVSIATAGKIWGGTVGITASYQAFRVATGSILVIASDSGSVSPRMPQEDDHWRALGLSPWGSYWGMQEPSGSNFMGSGSAGFMLTANPGAGQGILYQQKFPGWTRAGVIISGSSAGQGITAASGTGPDVSQQSFAFLGYINLGVSTNGLPILGVPAIAGFETLNASFGTLELFFNSPVVQLPLVGPNSMVHGDRIHPYLFIWNRTADEIWTCTDVSLMMTSSVPQGTAVDAYKGFGGRPDRAAPSASLYYLAMATGSIVEALCSISASADLLSRLGWNVDWKDCPTDSGSVKLPFLADHWKQLGLLPWTATWNLQEPKASFNSFNMWDGTDDQGWVLSANAVDGYNYSLPNWKRSFVNFANLASHRAIRTCVYGSPPQFDPTGSMAFLVYAQLHAGNNSNIMGIGSQVAGGGTWFFSAVSNSGNPILACSGSSVTGSFSVDDGRVHPIMIVQDVTNQRTKLYTDLESVTGSYNRLAIVNSLTASIGFGGVTLNGGFAASGNYAYFAFTTGALAETMSDDGVASHFLKTLGWTIPW